MKKVIFSLIFSTVAYGLTLEEAVNIGLKNNPQLKEYKQEIKISQFQLKEDKQLFMPFFFSKYEYTWLKDTPYTSIPPSPLIPVPISFKQSENNYYSFNIGLSYPVYTGGIRPAKIKISKLDIKAKKYSYLEKENEIKTQIKKAYYDVLMAKALVDIYKAEKRAVEKHLETVKAFHEEGLVTKVDILQAQVRLSEVIRDLRKAEGNLKIAKSHLAVLIGKDIDFPFNVEPIKEPDIKKLDIYYLIARAYDSRPVIKQIKTNIKQIKKLENIHKGEFLPKVSLTTFYTRTEQFPYMTPKENLVLSLNVELKFQGIKPYYSILKEKEKTKKIQFLLEDVKKKIALQVKAAYENLQTSIYNLDVARKALKQAQEYYLMVKEQYKNQLASGTDVIDAEAALTRARRGKEISYYQYLKAIADLEKAVGGSIR